MADPITLEDARNHAKFTAQGSFLVHAGPLYFTLHAVDAWLDMWRIQGERVNLANVTLDEIRQQVPGLQVLAAL